MSLFLYGSELDTLESLLIKHTSSVDNNPHCLLLKNKYYTAQIQISSLPASSLPSASASTSGDGNNEDNEGEEGVVVLSEQLEAYICVLTWKQAQTPEACISLLKQAQRASGESRGIDIDVRILVLIGDSSSLSTTSTNTNTSSSGEIDRESVITSDRMQALLLWCLDYGFELIFIDTNPTQLMLTETEREKEGLPRLIESLEAHTWSSMVLKNASDNGTERERGSGNEGESLGDGGVFAFAPPPVSTSSGSTNTSTNTNTNPNPNTGLGDINPFLAALSASNPNTGADDGGHTGDTGDTDDEVAFMSMIEQARKMREEVEKGNFNDKERKEKAAEMAMMLASMLKLDEDDDD